MVRIPDDVGPTKITIGIYGNADGTTRHVPTKAVI